MEQSLLANRFHFRVRRELFLNPEPLQTSECREIDLRPPTLPGVALLIPRQLMWSLQRRKESPLDLSWWGANCLAARCSEHRMGWGYHWWAFCSLDGPPLYYMQFPRLMCPQDTSRQNPEDTPIYGTCSDQMLHCSLCFISQYSSICFLSLGNLLRSSVV